MFSELVTKQHEERHWQEKLFQHNTWKKYHPLVQAVSLPLIFLQLRIKEDDKSIPVNQLMPIYLQIKTGDRQLILHPVVLALIKKKFRRAWPFYAVFSLFFIGFLALYTAYMIREPKPYFNHADGRGKALVPANGYLSVC